MARIPGRLAKAFVSTNGGSSYTEIKGIADVSFSGSQAEIKTTSHDDGAFEAYIAGRIEGSIELKCRWDENDAGQIILSSGFWNGSTYDWQFYMQVGTGFKQILAKGIVTKHGEQGNNDDVGSYDVTVRLTGTITFSNQ